MRLQQLAKQLSNPARIGLSPPLAEKLRIRSEDITRAQLMAMDDEERSFLGVYLLGAYVVDDTDLWGDGEVYWYSIPAFVNASGLAWYDPVIGLPTGDAPHKVGSHEWMQNVSLKDPPLLALIPPDDDIAACVLRLAFYDDDKEPADMPAAMSAGLEVLSTLPREPAAGTDHILAPVRHAIFRALKADDDDILIDQDLTLRRGERTRFLAGLVNSEINAMIRIYYFVRDERRTEVIGPMALHRGQCETIRFDTRLETGGKLAIFARGADVNVLSLGSLTTDMPFMNRVVDSRNVEALRAGINLNGTGPAKAIAFYTPP